MGGGGVGEAGSEGWSGESRGNDAASDSGTEEEEGEHAPLMALPWGTQESGVRGLRVGARAGGSGGGIYGKSSKPTGPRDGRVVLQLHPALDLLNHRPVSSGVQMP